MEVLGRAALQRRVSSRKIIRAFRPRERNKLGSEDRNLTGLVASRLGQMMEQNKFIGAGELIQKRTF